MKIKSVRLKNDYRTEDFVYSKGIAAEIENNDCYRFHKDTGEYLLFYKSDIENNKTDLFEIEYEEETKCIDVRIEYKAYVNNGELNTNNISSALDNYYYKHFSEVKVTKLEEGTL